jgi:hypothetical protein
LRDELILMSQNRKIGIVCCIIALVAAGIFHDILDWDILSYVC